MDTHGLAKVRYVHKLVSKTLKVTPAFDIFHATLTFERSKFQLYKGKAYQFWISESFFQYQVHIHLHIVLRKSFFLDSHRLHKFEFTFLIY